MLTEGDHSFHTIHLGHCIHMGLLEKVCYTKKLGEKLVKLQRKADI